MNIDTCPFTAKRLALGLTRADLAARLDTGYERICAIERGLLRRIPTRFGPQLEAIGFGPFDALEREYSAWRTAPDTKPARAV